MLRGAKVIVNKMKLSIKFKRKGGKETPSSKVQLAGAEARWNRKSVKWEAYMNLFSLTLRPQTARKYQSSDSLQCLVAGVREGPKPRHTRLNG